MGTKLTRYLPFAAVLAVPVILSIKDRSLIRPGNTAPDFTARTDKGDKVTLSSFRGNHNVVLVFYPGNETPVCTKQLCEIRDSYADFIKKGVKVFGINPGQTENHQRFSRKYAFQFPLLVDSEKMIAKAYGTASLFMQKRTVYVVDRSGTVVYAKRGKPPVSEILAALE